MAKWVFQRKKIILTLVACRPNGRKYVWDGLEEQSKNLLCNMKEIACSVYTHNLICKSYLDNMITELFLAKNDKNETMGNNNFARIIWTPGEEQAKEMRSVLDRANIDILGLIKMVNKWVL